MEIEKYQQAKKIDDKINEFQNYKLDLLKGCYIILQLEGKEPLKNLTWEEDIRKLLISSIDKKIEELEEKFKQI